MKDDEVLQIETEGKYLENLYFNVLLQSFCDLSTNIDTGECAVNKERADEWMNLENDEFLLICSFADINPEKVIKAKNRLLKDGRKLRIFKT